MRGRPLNHQEIRAARRVFADRIDYGRARIIASRHPLTFLLPGIRILAPAGAVYWPDAPANLADDRHTSTLATFIHEMTHVMQYQSGMSLVRQGCLLHARRILTLGSYNPYEYVFDLQKPFGSYNIEQQAEIAVGIYFGHFPNILAPELKGLHRSF